MQKIYPFLKWAGGKRNLAHKILANIPEYNKYYEPFVGAGAVLFNLQPDQAIISDSNMKLINVYQVIKNKPNELIAHLNTYVNNKNFYLEVRKRNFQQGSDVERAADFIYCNKVGFNGLYRENKNGKFNVAYGDNKNAIICDSANIKNVSNYLQKIDIINCDFEQILQNVKVNDLVYMDPPYAPLTATSNFTNYQACGFNYLDQIRVRDIAVEIKNKGAHVIISNSAAPFILDLYKDFNVQFVDCARKINVKTTGRKSIKEVIITL